MVKEKLNNILLIVPAYNEEYSVGAVIAGLRQHVPDADVLVVNDGSKDLTAERARDAGAIVINLPFNLGIGGAVQTGYKYARDHGYEIAVQVDGDGQHNPSEIHKLLDALGRSNADLVIGSRFAQRSPYRASVMRRAGIFILATIISSIVRKRLTDPTSGFRAMNRKMILLFASTYPQDYPEPEAIILAHCCGHMVAEVPVLMNDRFFGESSITKIRASYYMMKVLLAILVDCFKTRPVLNGGGEGCL
jgi:glycosyltransferase involved in cell wall biosynthesis